MEAKKDRNRKPPYEPPEIRVVSESELFENLGQQPQRPPQAGPDYHYGFPPNEPIYDYGDFNMEPTYRIPLCTIHDEGESYCLRVELPGVEPDDIDLQLGRYDVVVTTEPKSDDAGSMSGPCFHGTLQLPEEIAPEECKCDHKHGLLTVTLPKAQTEPLQRVKVTAAPTRKSKKP